MKAGEVQDMAGQLVFGPSAIVLASESYMSPTESLFWHRLVCVVSFPYIQWSRNTELPILFSLSHPASFQTFSTPVYSPLLMLSQADLVFGFLCLSSRLLPHLGMSCPLLTTLSTLTHLLRPSFNCSGNSSLSALSKTCHALLWSVTTFCTCPHHLVSQ